MKTISRTLTAACVILLTAGATLSAPSVPDKCKASKDKVVAAYYACRIKADATAAAKGGTADYSKCTDKFTAKWNAAETAGTDMCPDHVGAAADMDSYIANQSSSAAAIVAGTQSIPTPPTPPSCGDGSVNDVGENCDGSDLDGHTCASLGLYGGSLACTGSCEFDVSGCTTCPGSSVNYAGVCWVLGAMTGDCTSACAAVGLAYDTATKSVAGSDGTDASCTGLLDLLGATGDVLNNPNV